jgi:Nucleoside 2-deoxyribosyltransferase
MIYIYNAGPMFSEADIKQRKEEGKRFEEVLSKSNQEYFIANPIDLPFDNTKVLTSKEIFFADYNHVSNANVFFFELATGDTGTCVELGNAIEKLMQGKAIKMYPIFTDLRLQRNNISGIECPIGFNSYLVGSLTANNIETYYSFNEAFEQFCKDFKLSN